MLLKSAEPRDIIFTTMRIYNFRFVRHSSRAIYWRKNN
jgi:hypothetical protein